MARFKPIKLVTAIIILLVGLLATPALGAPSERSDGGRGKPGTKTTSDTSTTSTNSSEQICDGDSGNKSDTGHGANQNGPHEVDGEGPYDDTCGEAEDPSSQNGNNTGASKGKPDAGTVGQADNKNPPGQNPNAKDDGNNGYECDGNNGIAKTNPAHTGCPKASSEPPAVRAAFASIGTVDCSDNIAEVFMRNDNNSVAGARTFTVTFDGTSTDYVLAAGASRTVNLVIPDDGKNHAVKVQSSGMTDKTATLRIPANCEELDLGASASIGSVDCTDRIAEVTMNNLNETAGGDRTFLVTFDGVSTSHLVAAGGTTTIDLTIPDTGTHSISVSSLGMSTQSATRAIPADCDTAQAGAAQIGSIDCEDNIAEVVLTNSNASGSRIFEVTANGVTTQYSVAPGSSRVLSLEFPKAGEFTKPGRYLVTVASAGLSDVTKTLTVPACVLGVTFQRPPTTTAGTSLKVLGGTLARTGSDPALALLVAVALLMLGLAFQAVSRKPKTKVLLQPASSVPSSWASPVVPQRARTIPGLRTRKRT